MPWQYYGTLSGVTDADINALPVPPVQMPNTVDALFVGEGGIPLTGGGLVTQNDVKMALAKIAYKLYGLPLTRANILAVPLRWSTGSDLFDNIRPELAVAANVVGGVLAPVTGGASLAASAIVSKMIMANAQPGSAAKQSATVAVPTNKNSVVVVPTQPQTPQAQADPITQIFTEIFNLLFGWL